MSEYFGSIDVVLTVLCICIWTYIHIYIYTLVETTPPEGYDFGIELEIRQALSLSNHRIEDLTSSELVKQ